MQKTKLITIFSILAFSIVGKAQQGLTTKQISIFKDGSSFVMKKGKITPTDSSFQLKNTEIPLAKYGTFWAFSNDLKLITSFSDSIKQSQKITVAGFADLLKVNKGKKAKIYFEDKNFCEGIVENIYYESNFATILHNANQDKYLVDVKTSEGKWITFLATQISRIEFSEKPIREMLMTNNKLSNVLKFDFKSNNSQDFTLMYLQEGLSWSPFYYMELKDDKRASLTLQAQVTNNAENINDTELNFVVGVPNFAYANKLDEMVAFLNQTDDNRNSRANYNLYQNVGSNTYNINSNYNQSRTANNAELDNEIATNVEDLYFYPLHHFSLKKGAKAMYPLLKQDIEVAHVFECNLMSNQGFIDRNSNNNLKPETKNPVFHSLKIKNESTLPWTAGLVFISKLEKDIAMPMGQDKLNFTASKGQTYVKITETPDIQVKQVEKEIERKEDTHYYDLVTIESTISIKNYKNKDANMNIRRLLYGELLKSDLKYEKEEVIVPSFNYINYSASNLCWEFGVKANEEKILKYTYKILVYSPN